MKYVKRDSGFTLVELLITVSVVGVLSTLAVPSFKRAIQRARTGEAKSYLGGLYQSEKSFAAEFGAFGNNLFKIGFRPTFPDLYFVGFTTGPSCTPRGAAQLRPLAGGVDPVSQKIATAFNNTFGYGMTPVPETISTPFYRGGSIVSPPATLPLHVCLAAASNGYRLRDGSNPGAVPADVYDRTNPLRPDGIPNAFFATATGVITNSVSATTGSLNDVDAWGIDHEGTLIHVIDGVK